MQLYFRYISWKRHCESSIALIVSDELYTRYESLHIRKQKQVCQQDTYPPYRGGGVVVVSGMQLTIA